MVKYSPILKIIILKCQTKLEFFKMYDIIIQLGKYPSNPGKTKITKVNLLMNLATAPQNKTKARTNNICLPLKKIAHRTSGQLQKLARAACNR
jgi:hypothetical protein